VRKGDQLVVEAHVRSNNWVDKQGAKQYDYDFVVDGFRFGAPGKIKREEFGSRRAEGSDHAGEHLNGLDTEIPLLEDENDSPLVGPGSVVLASSQSHHSYVGDGPGVEYVADPGFTEKSAEDGAVVNESVDESLAEAPAPKATAGKPVVKKKTLTRGRRA
jgi:single-stranded DNA-binding protein